MEGRRIWTWEITKGKRLVLVFVSILLSIHIRFLDITLTGRHNITSGKIYKEVIRRERRGDYLGKTVQIVPHVTDMVQTWIKEVSKIPVDGSGHAPDVCLIEVGGTVGDIESMVFLEALRQFQFVVGRDNILFVHVSLVPVVGSVGEQKSKPTQHSVKVRTNHSLSFLISDLLINRNYVLLAYRLTSSFADVARTFLYQPNKRLASSVTFLLPIFCLFTM